VFFHDIGKQQKALKIRIVTGFPGLFVWSR
jgi:hypothetical protein